jgi:SAM-dependent methyltransferase
MMKRLRAMLRNAARDLLYPGLDLHTRNRAALRRFWRAGARDLLDAGSGNGYFSWLAYRSGARVVALNFEPNQVERARNFLFGHGRADREHLARDGDVVAQFYRILRPGGVLHVCCPNARHPRHQAEMLDDNELGGHVRAGYTAEHYRALLEPAGFAIRDVVGIGPAGVYHADRLLRAVRNRLGDAFALPLLPLALPFVWAAPFDPPTPFSLYVRAEKPQCPAS